MIYSLLNVYMLCVTCITNSLRLTDKHCVGKEFHKSAQGGKCIWDSGELKKEM